MPLNLLLLALAPGLVIAVYIYLQDKYEREPVRLLLRFFGLGMLSTFPAMFMENYGMKFFNDPSSVYSHLFQAFLIVGFSEEFCKFYFVRVAFKRPEFNEPFDGIVYSVMVALGFATLENVMYVYQYGEATGWVRMFTAVPAHAANGVIMGYFFGLAKFRQEHQTRLLLTGLFWATFFHGAYDFCLFVNELLPIAAGATVTLVVAVFLSRKAIRLHAQNSPFHPQNFFKRNKFRT